MLSLSVNSPVGLYSFVDRIELGSCGILHVLGWQRDQADEAIFSLNLAVNEEPRSALYTYRYQRSDVPPVKPQQALLTGVCLEYDLGACEVHSLRLYLQSGQVVFLVDKLHFHCELPHYFLLRKINQVLHREDIYGSGPPVPVVSSEVLTLAKTLPSPVLDFGCGVGALIGALRLAGLDVLGLELDRPAIREGLAASVAPYVTLYHGSLPLPFADRSFESVVCSEVLEHIADYQGALKEIARVCRSRALFTVPDMSAIPILHKHNVVPWHLLEATHVNFFTQLNLSVLLEQHFRRVDFLRIGAAEINGSRYWNTLVALCEDPR